MVKKLSDLIAAEKALGSRLMFGGLAVVAATVVATSGVAAAHQLDPGDDPTGPANVQLCKDHYKDFGFKNVGQCVAFFNSHHGGHGYGGHGHHHHKHHHHHHHFHFDFGNWWHKFF